MPDDLLNKLITECWHRLDPNAQKLYERYAKEKLYYQDVKGEREFRGAGKKEKVFTVNGFNGLALNRMKTDKLVHKMMKKK